MNYFSYVVFLILLSGLSLATIMWVWLLDFFATSTLHKLRTLKVGLTLLVSSPVAVGILTKFCPSAAVFEFTSNALFMPIEKLASLQEKTAGFDYFWVLFLIHITIFCFLLLRIAYAMYSTKQRLKNSNRVLINGQPVWLNKNLSAPLSFGIPGKIYAPDNIEISLGTRKTELALAHEKAHVQNFDTLWKLASLVAQALLFFAPWSYFFHKKFMLEIETLCDEIACKNTRADFQEYGSFLLEMATQNSPNFICNNIADSTLKRRIIAMKKSTTYRPILTSMSCFTLILLSGLTIAKTAGALSPNEEITISSEVLFDGQLISSPVISTKLNNQARIEIGDKDRKRIFSMSVVPSIGPDEQIKLLFNIEDKGVFKAEVNIIVRPDQKGAISVKTDSGKILELRTIVNIPSKSTPKAL